MKPFTSILCSSFVLLYFCSGSSAAGDKEEDQAVKAVDKAGGYVGTELVDGVIKPRMLHVFVRTNWDAVEKQLKHLKSLDSVRFIQGREATDDQLLALEAVLGLKELWAGSVSEKGLEIIARYKKLEYLRTATTASNAGMKSLAASKSLRKLYLGAPNVTADGLNELAAIKTLETIGTGDMSDKSLKGIAQITSLKAIDMTFTGVTDKGLKELTGLKLTRLKLLKTGIGDEGIKHFAAFEDLEFLDLRETKITDEALKTIGKLKKLKTLSLEKTKITNVGLGYLGDAESLQTLHLGNTRVSGLGILQIANLKDLRIIGIGGTDVDQKGRVLFSTVNKKVQLLELVDPPRFDDEP